MKLRKIILGAALSVLCIVGTTACTPVTTSGNVADVVISTGDTVAEIEIEGFGTIKAELFPDIAPIGVKNFTMLAEQGYYDGKNIHRVMENFMMQGGSLNGDGTGGDAAYSGEGSTAPSFGTEIDKNARHFYGALCYANALGQNSTQFYIVNSKEPQDVSEISADDAASIAEQAKAQKEQYEKDNVYYSYYESMEKQYTAVAEWYKDTPAEVAEKYKQGGTAFLDGGYTVFGQVVEGFDVIDSISGVEVTENASGEMSQPVEDIIIKTVKVYTAE